MKYFIAIALIAAVASAKAIIKPADLQGLSPAQAQEVQQILDAINSPSTDPTTAAMLEEMLANLLGLTPVKPPINLPAIIDEFEPVHVGPEIVEVGDFEPIVISPEIVDFPVDVDGVVAAPAPAPQAPSSTPLVQIIVNVNADGTPAANPVQVDNVNPSPVVVVDKPKPEVAPTPVIVVDKPQVAPTPVQVVDSFPEPEPVIIGHLPEPVIVAPIDVAPVVVGPDTLN